MCIGEVETQKLGEEAKNKKNSDALDTGGGAHCYNRQHSEPGVVPGNSKWEIPDNNDSAEFSVG